jgi:2-keto-3-deoxy-L-rhamnonate aldolase RhmA
MNSMSAMPGRRADVAWRAHAAASHQPPGDMPMSDKIESFRSRLTAGETIVGTFMKTPLPLIAEVLALSRLDVIAIDREHAPFGHLESDLCIGALRAAGMPSVVRVADDTAGSLRNALDSGANGVVVPHVTSPSQAERIVSQCHFGAGGRGFAGWVRAGDYGTRPMEEYLSRSVEHTTVVVQIEDLPALDRVADIAAVDGVDALFIGRTDLAVAMQKSPMDAAVVETVEDICKACIGAGKPIGMFTPDLAEIPKWRELGASFFLLGSDHGMVLDGANRLADAFD